MDQISLAISIFSLLISLAAVSIAVWHNIKSFTPILTVVQNNSSINSEISIVIENKGIGPATLIKLEFVLNGTSIGNNANEIVRILEAKNLKFQYFFQYRGSGSVLSSGDKFIPIKLVFADNHLPEEATHIFNHLSTYISYKSVYGIKYKYQKRIEYQQS